MTLVINQNISPCFSDMVFYVNKTFDYTLGQLKVTRLAIACLKLFNELNPQYKEWLTPMSEAIYGYRSFCYATLIIPKLKQAVVSRKLVDLYGLVVASSLTAKYLFDVKILEMPFSERNKLPLEKKEVPYYSLANAASFIGKNIKHLCIGGEALIVIGIISVSYFKAVTPKEKKESSSNERCLLLANRLGKLGISTFALLNWQYPVFIACLDVTTSLAGYAKYLVAQK